MDGYNAFRPRGDTLLIVGSTAGPISAQAGGPGGGDVSYLLCNMGSNDAYVGYGPSSAVAANNSAIPLIGTNFACIPVPGRQQRIVTLTPALFFCATTPSSQTPVMITPGDGV